MTPNPQLYVNPACSKSRAALALLQERGVLAEEVHYLEHAPSVAELESLMVKLGVDDPRLMMRTGEPAYEELGLGEAPAPALLEAVVRHPILLERPIFVVGDHAVIARPPERVLDLL